MESLHWPVLLDLAWFLFLVLVFRYFWRLTQELLQARHWLKTKGHIISCEWVAERGSLWPKVEYIYQVNDQEIIGEYLFLDTAHNTPSSRYSRQVAYEVAMAFKESREIDVFYNPNDPKQSALNISIPRKLKIILALLGFALVAHFILMVSRFI